MTNMGIEAFLAICRHKNISKAADELYITQASLSARLKALEEELGVMLLDRSKKPVIPTEAGAVVIAQAQETLKAYNTIRESVAELKGETAGKLRLGVIPTIAPYLLHKFIPDFVKSYPRVELEIREMVTADIVEALRRDKIDAALVASGTCGEQLTWVLSENGKLTISGQVTIDGGEPFVANVNFDTPILLSDTAAEHKVTIRLAEGHENNDVEIYGIGYN